MLHLVLSLLLLVADPFNWIHAMKPVQIDPADSAVRKMMKERFNERLVAVQKTERFLLINVSDAGPSREQMLYVQLPPFIAAGVALEEQPADRVKWFELHLATMRELERVIRIRFEGGYLPRQSLYIAKADRIDAEIDLPS